VLAGDELHFDQDHWYIFYSGDGTCNGSTLGIGEEFGYRPYSNVKDGTLQAGSDCHLVRFPKKSFNIMLANTPQLNYLLRKYRIALHDPAVDWLLGDVTTN
jgi:hypothetical protein